MGATGIVNALDAATGAVVWKTLLTGSSGKGCGVGAVVVDDVVVTGLNLELETWTAELRLQGEGMDGKLNYMFGGFYSDESIDQSVSFALGQDYGENVGALLFVPTGGALGANPLTVAKAYQSFQDEGLVLVKRGVGMFVARGAAERLRRSERDAFLAVEWPAIRQRMDRLGIVLADLLQEG